MPSEARKLTISVDSGRCVSGLLTMPPRAPACYILAHGAGAGMTHPFISAVAEGLSKRGIGSLRYQFPYMEQNGKRPDPPRLAQATVRAAVREAARLTAPLPLIAGGKSFGGRMTSQAQAVAPLPEVRGLVFLGFPLHAAGKPSDTRAAHLFEVKVPMLFLQGTRDALADLMLLRPLINRLGARTALRLFEAADHSFRVPARSGRADAEVMDELLDALAEWIIATVSSPT